jgi:hypothetical protein
LLYWPPGSRRPPTQRIAAIITASHYVLKDTTVASGEWEGMRRDQNGAWQSCSPTAVMR